MSDPERDAELARRYRELAREEPPRSLDAGILAAAARELELRPAPLVAPTARRSWTVPLAAAAVIVLSVAVTLHLQREQPDPELGLPEQVSPTAQPAPPARPQAEASREAPKETAVASRQATNHRAAAARAADQAPKATKAPATEAKPFPESARPASPASRTPAQAGDAAPPPQAVETQPGAPRDLARRSSAEGAAGAAHEDLAPEAWLARIIEMRRAGRHAQADASYAAFRRRYPDYRIPEAMREQVMTR